jgi:selenocysteine lyase/cysteine desulfurase
MKSHVHHAGLLPIKKSSVYPYLSPMQSQRHLFQLPDDVHYINCAYMSPLLKSAEKAAIKGVSLKRDPSVIKPHHFFDGVEIVKEKFAQIIHAEASQIAIIPSASYGLMNAVQNVNCQSGQHAITVVDEFPSGQFALDRWCQENDAELIKIQTDDTQNKCHAWNSKILESINEKTAMVLMSSVHWMDGTLFYLDEIGRRCRAVGATFIVDGSQSVGALPIHVDDCHIDALICAGYKWLLGPYSLGIAYYGEHFNDGRPIEESWMNRNNARNFSNLTDYDPTYRPGAQRYSVGEATNWIHLPMLDAGLQQLLDWGVPSVQSYCKHLTDPLINTLKEMDFQIEDDEHRAFHLFGLRLPLGFNIETFMDKLQKRNIFLSVRGRSIRISPHLYNTSEEIDLLTEAITETIRD